MVGNNTVEITGFIVVLDSVAFYGLFHREDALTNDGFILPDETLTDDGFILSDDTFILHGLIHMVDNESNYRLLYHF